MKSNNKFFNWAIFIILCFIWGSSFILMKKGMFSNNGSATLSPYHVAAIRLLSAGLVLLPFAVLQWKKISREKVPLIILSGFLGGFFPAFLFCIAETKIDSSLVGTLNSLTPLFVIITGMLFFKTVTGKNKTIGVITGLFGCVMLFMTNKHTDFGYLGYSGLVLLATIFYGFNVNIIHTKLADIKSLQIASIGFTALIIPALIVLYATHFFDLPLHQKPYLISLSSSVVLGVAGTALANIMFYMLVKRAGGLFSSLVTYGIPFVAIFWGVLDGEQLTAAEIGSLFIILTGVYLANRK